MSKYKTLRPELPEYKLMNNGIHMDYLSLLDMTSFHILLIDLWCLSCIS